MGNKKDIRDLKFEEMLEDINAVKERMKERNIREENQIKLNEMNMFMDEIQNSLDEIENEYESLSESSEDEREKLKLKKMQTKNISVKRRPKERIGKSIVDSIKKELVVEDTKERSLNIKDEIPI